MTVMPSSYSFRESSVTVGATSGSVTSAYGSTYMTGFVDNVYVAASSAVSTGIIVKITSSSTSNVILTVSNPSTLGVYYWPRGTASIGGTTVAIADHPTSQAVPISLFSERVKVAVVATTVTTTGTIATVRLRINPLY